MTSTDRKVEIVQELEQLSDGFSLPEYDCGRLIAVIYKAFLFGKEFEKLSTTARAEAAEADHDRWREDAERLAGAARDLLWKISEAGAHYGSVSLDELRAALAAHDAAAGDKAVAYQCNDPLCDCWGDTPFRHCPGCNELYLWSKNEPTTPCLDCQSHAAAGGGANTATLQAEVDELGRRLAENHAKLKALGVAGGESGEE